MTTTTLVLNGTEVSHPAPAHFTLLRWLRDRAGAFDVKYGCGEGVCGACTVVVDGATVSSCTMLAVQAEGRRVTTITGAGGDPLVGALQDAFVGHGAAQCGFCTPGMLLTAAEALRDEPGLDRAGIRAALHGNLCRCTGYQAIVDAVELVSREGASHGR